MKRIRVLMVTRYLDRGGMEQVILTIARGLRRERFDLTVAAGSGGAAASAIRGLGDVRLVVLPGTTHGQRLRQLLALARECKPDIIHNHFSWYGLAVGLLTRARRIETMHNLYDWWTGAHRLAYALYLLLATRIIAVSQYVLDFNLRYFRIVARSKCAVVYNGVDAARFEAPGGESQLREGLGIPERPHPVVVFTGRLEPPKGVDALLAATAHLRQSGKRFTLVVAGDGSQRQALEGQARLAGLDNVVFAGFVADVPGLLGASDIFVLPSLYEGLPLSLLEAMAAGLPAVATSVGGVPEVIQNGVSGFLVAPGDATSLADRLGKLIDDAGLRVLLGGNARRRVREHFSAEEMVRATEGIYEEVFLRGSRERSGKR